MLTGSKAKISARHYVAAALLCASAATLAVTTQTIARPSQEDTLGVAFENVPEGRSDRTAVAKAVEGFVQGMVSHDDKKVWMFASEEDQDAFATERAVYAAYAETFPEFAKAREVTFTRFWQEGDTPFVQALVSDATGMAEMATMGFWLDDAGDWKLVSCDVKPVSNLMAGL